MKNKILYWLAPILLFLLVLVVYSLTMPNINTGYADSDEFITVAKIFGVPHPPAYPLYTMLAALFGRLPIPFLTFAGRVNFLNVVLHSFTVVFVYLICLTLLKNFFKERYLAVTISLLGALSLAFMFSFWFFALFAEVFTLNNFFIALTFYLLVKWEEAFKAKRKNVENYLIVAALTFGLGLSSQQIIVLLFPAFFVWIFFTHTKIIFNWKLILKGSLITAAAALLPYLYLPIASRFQPAINWENPQNLTGIVRAITRKVYAEASPKGVAYFNGNIEKAQAFEGIQRIISYMITNYTIVFCLLGLIGILFLLFKKKFKLLTTLLLSLVGAGLLFTIYQPLGLPPEHPYYFVMLGIYERFYLSLPIFYSILIAFGVAGVFLILRKFSPKLALAGLLLLFIFTLNLATTNFKEIKRNDFNLAHRYAKTLLESLKPNSILLCFSEHTCFSAVYLQEVEGLRKDVSIIAAGFGQRSIDQIKKQYPGLIRSEMSIDSAPQQSVLFVRDLIRRQIDKRPLYIAGISTSPDIIMAYGIWGNPFYLVPDGCLLRISKKFYLSSTETCGGVENEAIGSFITPKAHVSFMFKGYMMYQRYLDGYIYAKLVCNKPALLEFRRAQKIIPDSKELQRLIHKLKDIPEYDVCYGDTSEVKLDDILTKGDEYEKKKDIQTALFYALQATLLKPDDVDLRFKLADLYQKTGSYRNAIFEYSDILTLDPNNEKAKIGYLNMKRNIELESVPVN